MDDIDRRFMELYQEIGHNIGIDDTLALNIFSRLYIETEPISMEDLAKETGYSLASVSNSMKMMAGISSLKKTRKPGSKKVFLFLEKDFLSIVHEHFMRHQAAISAARETIPLIIRDCKEKTRSKKDKDKLKVLEDYQRQISALDDSLAEFTKCVGKK
jgi:DNA-binding transcriptional regulator GbsR (MarR family)